MEHVKMKITLTNVIVTLDTLAKTVNMITVSIQHVLTMVHVIVDNIPTHATARLVTWGKIANVLTVIQTSV